MRRDVLVRHTSSVHGIVTKHRKPSCVNCALQKLKCDGDQDDKCKRCDHLQLECVYKQPKSSSRASEPPRKRARTSPSSPERDPSEAGSLPSVESSAHPVQHLAPAIMPPPPLFHHQPTPSTSTSRRPLPPPATNVPEASPFASTSSAAPAYLAQRPAPQPASPLWQPAYNFSAERTSAALSNMAPFDFLPNIIDPSADVAASFDASAGWGLGDTELDLVGMFDLGGDPANGARPTVPAQAGYETPVDWLRLLGSFRESSAAAPAAPTPGVAPSGAPAGLPSLSQAPPPPPPPQGLPRRESVAGVSPHATLSAADSLATPSDGGGPEAPTATPWPHVYQPVAPVGPLSLPTVPNPPPPLVFEQPGATVTSQVRAAMIQLVSESHQSPWAGIALDSFPSASVLSICLKLYLSRFHATFPILDPASLETASSSPLLLLACAAVGAMYRADFEGLGVALTEIVRRTTLWMREQDPRASFELEVVQAWLVSSIAGLFCGSRKLYQHAEIARCGLLTAARRMELLRETPSCVDELCSRKAPEPYELAAARREDELRLRLGWGCYVFDNLVASLLHLQPVVSIEEIAATTLLPSESFAPDPQGRVRFRATLAALLNDGRIEQPLTPFSTLITQLSLYRLCLDASNLSTVLAGVIPTTRLGTYRLSFSPDIRHNPQELLDRIGSAWHSSSVNVTSLHVMATALAYHAALQFSCGDFLSQAKVCAGKYGGDRAARAREWVRRKAETDPVAVRRVLARALQLNALLVRHRFDTPPETIWLADSALAVWAIITFAGRTLTDTPTALQVVTTIKWNDPGNSAEPWIQCGGPLSLRSGLGEYGSATPGSVLRKFSEHLEDLPWGLSRKYRAVLLQLSQEE
ncbi:hypothetical protein DMC30DRAFT_91059 [Rhodotorula diobovata]|uniref:Zn(2)-C6 fungal-type domain-containing protein n=1 Tax=Rhodotorula diobovata TaxID=5288 RepID=A0A5C5FLW6_9BASI|nr:hypothetical protein DMC30DRAFT_91059 [Rhodotorula diobovata]